MNSLWHKIKSTNPLAWFLVLLVGMGTVYPLGMLFAGSFAEGGHLSLRSYVTTFSDMDNYRLLGTTLWLAAARTLLATGMAIFLAWVVTRTNTPLRGLLETLIWVAFFIPSLPLALGWMTLALPRTGLINVWLTQAFNLSSPPFNVQSYGGLIFVSILPWTSMLFILLVPALRGMDASLEEASKIAGAGVLTTLRRITIPLISPALLGVSMLALVRMMESFEIELLLGYPAQIYVFATRVYDRLTANPVDYGSALSLSTVFLVMVFPLMLYQWQLLKRGERYATITGKGFATRVTDIGRWKYVTLSVVLFYFALAVAVPVGSLILGTFMKVPGLFNVAEPYTTEHYGLTFADTMVIGSIRNTFFVAFISATLGMVLYAVMSYINMRTRFAGRSILEFFSWLPYSVPSIVMGLGFLWAFVGGIRLPFAPYGSLQLLTLVFLVKGMPLGVRVMNGSMIQMGRDLEESSRISGASPLHTFRKITAPLMRPAFLSAWMILFSLVIRDVASVILLYGPKSRVISVLMLEYWNTWLTGRASVLALIMLGITLIGVTVASVLGLRRPAVL